MFVGRIVRDVSVRNVGVHGRVVNNVIAINHHHKDANGERNADFIPFAAWNHYADLLMKYAAKGHQVAIAGKMQSRSYKDNENKDRYVIECLVDEITLLQPKDSHKSKQAKSQKQNQDLAQSEQDQIDEASIRTAIPQQ